MNARSLIMGWESKAILRHSPWDAVFIGLAAVHAAVLLSAPSIPAIAILLWWNSNTVSHNFIHLPFFRSSVMNRLFSMYLTLLLGFPQSLWRDRHLAHHRGKGTVTWTPAIAVEFVAVIGMWSILLARMPEFFLRTYLPGYAAGLLLGFVHGYFEHWRSVTSHYGTAYNTAFFNDGYHVEHHLCPGEHWSRLPVHTPQDARVSPWPAVLRWMETVNLETLERVTMRSAIVRAYLLKVHERAFRRLLPKVEPIRTIKIVGGGLFPRTAMVLRKLMPDAEITIVDKSIENLRIAKTFLQDHVVFVNEFYGAVIEDQADILVVPLAFAGDRAAIYCEPPAQAVLVHDWIWRKRGESAVVAWGLLKRLNLVTAKNRHEARRCATGSEYCANKRDDCQNPERSDGLPDITHR